MAKDLKENNQSDDVEVEKVNHCSKDKNTPEDWQQLNKAWFIFAKEKDVLVDCINLKVDDQEPNMVKKISSTTTGPEPENQATEIEVKKKRGKYKVKDKKAKEVPKGKIKLKKLNLKLFFKLLNGMKKKLEREYMKSFQNVIGLKRR